MIKSPLLIFQELLKYIFHYLDIQHVVSDVYTRLQIFNLCNRSISKKLDMERKNHDSNAYFISMFLPFSPKTWPSIDLPDLIQKIFMIETKK